MFSGEAPLSTSKLLKYSVAKLYLPEAIIELPIVITLCMSASANVGAALFVHAPLFKRHFINKTLPEVWFALFAAEVAGKLGMIAVNSAMMKSAPTAPAYTFGAFNKLSPGFLTGNCPYKSNN